MTYDLPLKTFDRKKDKAESTQWYREKKDPHTAIFAAIDQINLTHRTRCQNNAKLLALYENNADARYAAHLRPTAERLGNNRLTFNVIQSCIDAVYSKIAKNRPKPEFITTGADWRLIRKAANMNLFMEGTFYQNNVYHITPDIFLDAALFGTGVVSIYHDGESIKYERVLIDEILVDDYEGMYRSPKQMFHVRRVFRDTLLQRAQDEGWSQEKIEKIKDAPPSEASPNSIADMIDIAEAWYLAPNKKNKTSNKSELETEPSRSSAGYSGSGGRYAVAIQNCTLTDEDYEKEYFPFAFYRWKNRRVGFYGMGLAEELVAIQRDINKVIAHIDKNMAYTGLHLYNEMGSRINPASLTSKNGAPLTSFQGAPVMAATWPAVSAETYKWLDNLYSKAFEISGVSQMTAFAQKEPGVTANSALMTLADQQTERFMPAGQRFEELHIEIARVSVDLLKDLNESDLSVSVVNSRGYLDTLSFSENEMPAESYQLKCSPISSFSSSPTARRQEINEGIDRGYITPQKGAMMMGMDPDFKDEVNRQTASLERVRDYLDLMKNEGRYLPPDAYMNLPEAIEEAKAVLNISIRQRVPENHIDMMKKFIRQAQLLLNPPPEETVGGSSAIDPGAPAAQIGGLPAEPAPEVAEQPL